MLEPGCESGTAKGRCTHVQLDVVVEGTWGMKERRCLGLNPPSEIYAAQW